MAITLDDAHIKVTIDTEAATKQADKLDTRLKEKEKRRKREREESEKKEKSKWAPDSKGIGSDLLHGRAPGLSRFGAMGTKVAGALGAFYAIEAILPTVIGFATSFVLPDAWAKKIQGWVDDAVGATIGKVLPALTAGLTAKEEAGTLATSLAAAGRPIGEAGIAEFWKERFAWHWASGRGERASTNIARTAFGSALGTYLKDEVKKALGLEFSSVERPVGGEMR